MIFTAKAQSPQRFAKENLCVPLRSWRLCDKTNETTPPPHEEALTPLYLAQVLTQLRLADLHLGFLINFNVERIKDGIRRIILS